ncbi:MAG: S9 family peptidase [Acidobacteria bacterium]|nr:MAG: S9 family peptidase [Acidobacteriota bacterium]
MLHQRRVTERETSPAPPPSRSHLRSPPLRRGRAQKATDPAAPHPERTCPVIARTVPRTSSAVGLAVLALLSAPGLCAAQPGAAAADAAVPEPRHLELADYLDWERVSDPQLSPDLTKMVYTRHWVDKIADQWRSSVWITDADGSGARFLLEGSSPRWSPDGTRIAYVAEGEPKGAQIHVRWMDAAGGTTQITRVEKAPTDLQWSPDGKQIAFVSLVPTRTDWQIDMPKPPEGAKWTESPRIVESVTYRRDRQGFIEEGFRQVFVVTAEGGTPRQLTDGEYHSGGDLSWTPDGSEILFSSLRDDEWEYAIRESDVYAVNVRSGAIRQLTTRKGVDQDPVVSPDGKWVAYTGYDWTDDTYIDSKLHLMRLDGSDVRVLTPELDRSPFGLMWAEDSSGVYFNVSDSGTRNLHFAPVGGGARQITDGEHMLTVSMLRGGVGIGVATSAQEPDDVYAVNLGSGEMVRFTNVNEDVLAGVELGEVEEIWYDSVGDQRIQGWIVKPPGFDPQREEKYPLMLAIHGGPHGMYNTGFSFSWQEHAANGYVVLYTNPRGSSGYGSAFGNAIKWAYPSQDYDDLMRGVDEVLARGYVDAERLYVYGCSGGGVLTAWVVGHTERFAAASSNCPVTNWLSFVGTTDGPSYWYRNFEKDFWEDPSEHLRRSPIMYVGNVTTPTMLMTGVDDLRTPISQTEEYYQALKMRKVPTAMVRFNEEYHGTSSKPSNFLRTQLYHRHWFERWGEHDGEDPPAAADDGEGDEEPTVD